MSVIIVYLTTEVQCYSSHVFPIYLRPLLATALARAAIQAKLNADHIILSRMVVVFERQSAASTYIFKTSPTPALETVDCRS